MLRYQASMYTDQYDNVELNTCHPHSQPSTIASSNGLRGQQSRLIRRQPTTTYKSLQTSRLAPRRRFIVMETQKSMTGSSGITFPGPDYLKRMKENYESGKVIYIRRSSAGLKNSSTPTRMTSTITNSIRSTTYHTTTTPVNGKMTVENSGSVPKYVFRLPKSELNKFDENRPNNNMFVPAYEPLKVQYTTVPACMSMGGEIVYEEEVDDGEDSKDQVDDLMPAEGFNSSPPASSSSPVVPKSESPDSGYLKSSGQLVPSNYHSNQQSYKMLPIRNRLQPTRFTCPQQDCFWRGPTDLALRKHMQIHGPKQPVMYSGNKNNEMKVQLVQPKPKGVKCSECDTFAYSRPLLLRHMHDAHGIEAPLIRRTFANREMLQTWLDSLRETHAVEFVVSSGSKKWGRGLQVHYLTCSRSGDQKERPNKKYVRPPRPSIKCGRNCMAYLKIKQNPTVSELQIEGCLHHSGHEIDHTRMMLEQNELNSIGTIVEAVNEGLDILGNAEVLRGYLGSAGRFRLVSDRGIIEQMATWFEQYHRSSSDYLNEGNQLANTMYRGSGALTLPVTQHSYCNSGSLLPMKSPASSARRTINLGKMVGREVKRETDYSMPIRFTPNQIQQNQNFSNSNKFGFSQQNNYLNVSTVFDETKVKVELDEEETLAAQNLLRDDFDDIRETDLFDSPMLSGEDSNRLVEDDDILCAGEEANGVTSTIDKILSANITNGFDDLCPVDDITTDFSCGMDEAEFNELLGLGDFSSDRSIC